MNLTIKFVAQSVADIKEAHESGAIAVANALHANLQRLYTEHNMLQAAEAREISALVLSVHDIGGWTTNGGAR